MAILVLFRYYYSNLLFIQRSSAYIGNARKLRPFDDPDLSLFIQFGLLGARSI